MPTELTNLELLEVSLVDAGDDPHAKVSLFKRKPSKKGDNMNEEETLVEETTEKAKVEIEVEGPEEEADETYDMTEDKMCGEDKKPARKSYKAEAEALAQEVETLKAKVTELEAQAVAKAVVADEMIEVGGEQVAKSAVPAPILKKLEEMQKAAEVEALRKRAEEVLPNFKGTADERGKLLKSIGEDDVLLAILRAADAAFAGIYQEVGKTDAENDLKTPTEKLNDMVKSYQEDKQEKDFHKAYAAVIKTAPGRALVLETYKK